jgi:hypothetical protein
MISPIATVASPQALVAPGSGTGGGQQLDKDQQSQLQSLRKRDAEVRRHEAAHATQGGPYAGAPSYDYVRGPDGRLYAVGGEVKIDVTPAGSPQSTVAKMDQIIRAALAPSDPSPQDRAAAAEAQQIKQQAESDLRDVQKQQAAERRGEKTGGTDTSAAVLQAVQSYTQTAQLIGGTASAGSVFGAISA